MPTFNGDPHSATNHVVKFMRYLSKKNITQPCDQMELFVLSISPNTDWLESCKPKSIPSLPMLTTHFLLHEGSGFQSHEDKCQMLDVALREEEVTEYGFLLQEECLDPSPNHHDQVIDVYLKDSVEKETRELANMSPKDNDNEDMDPKSPPMLQEWMMECEKSCRQLMATYNSQEIFS